MHTVGANCHPHGLQCCTPCALPIVGLSIYILPGPSVSRSPVVPPRSRSRPHRHAPYPYYTTTMSFPPLLQQLPYISVSITSPLIHRLQTFSRSLQYNNKYHTIHIHPSTHSLNFVPSFSYSRPHSFSSHRATPSFNAFILDQNTSF